MNPGYPLNLDEQPSFVDWLEFHAQRQPGAEALYFAGHTRDQPGVRLDYAQLAERVRCCAAGLQQRLEPGAAVLILFPSGIDYVIALLACFHAGMIGVPVNLPGVARVRRVLPKISAIAADCGARAVLTHRDIEAASGEDLAGFAAAHALQLLHLDTLPDAGRCWHRPKLDGDTIAFLQYTSGSTGDPKGVVNRHGSLLRNLAFLGRLLGAGRADEPGEPVVVASWLPLFHDLGLIMGILAPLAYGSRAVYMPPMGFMADPLRWLELATQERATALPCPSFALRLCAQEAGQASEQRLAGLDLSRVQCLMPAAEPVLPAQIELFQQAFASRGMRREAIRPAYGLAEATLLVSTTVEAVGPRYLDVDKSLLERGVVKARPAEGEAAPAGMRRYVSNGAEFDGQHLRILEPASGVVRPAGHVGEILISGPCIAAGYWRRPDLNQTVFGAQALGADGLAEPLRFLRTGDMGFLHDGHLYVTGRCKDMMLFRGQCHYPNDIEATAGLAHPDAVADSGAAFSVPDDDQDDERLIVVQEAVKRVDADYRRIATSMRSAIAREHQLSAREIVLIRKGTLPRTTSGKVRRSAVREAYLAGTLQVLLHDGQAGASPAPAPTRAEALAAGPATLADAPMLRELAALNPVLRRERLSRWLAEQAAAALGTVSARNIDFHASLFDYGLDSVGAAQLSSRIAQACGIAVTDDTLFAQPSIEQLARRLLDEPRTAHRSPSPEAETDAAARPGADLDSAEPGGTAPPPNQGLAAHEPIAVIGMAFRLPGADGEDADSDAAFWRMLAEGGCAIRAMPAERFREPVDIPGFGAFLNRVDQFDAGFFGMSPREAANTDPQQRLLLEVAWHALEDAGLRPSRLRGGDTGVFVGIGTGDYGHLPFISGEQAHFDAYWGTGTSFAAACGRLSFAFGWEGPSMAVDTACSASHSALHLAVQSLRAGECGLALAAGVKLQLLPEIDRVLHKAGMLAVDGRCKTLDARADGYVRGEGCAILVLKRLDQALADGDAIRAVIRATAVRQDGAGSSLSAPNGAAQRRMLELALRRAGLGPADIDYLELHGTGTRLGDPIEYQSVAEVFAGRAADDPLWLGSVKTNIGHLEAAAGAAGLVKTILALEHATIPPLVGLQQLNPLLDLDAIPARAPLDPVAWPRRQARRRAGVTSYGFAGTIAHVVLEQAPESPAQSAREAAPAGPGPRLFLLSAASAESLNRLALDYRAWLAHDASPDLDALANTMACRRDHLPWRRAVSAHDHASLAEVLSHAAAPGEPARRKPRIGFLFTGQGSQYIGMGRDLYAGQAAFRHALDAADAALMPHLGQSIIALMHDDRQAEALARTAYAQPALFALGYALARMWQAWGVEPLVVLGHSIGEFAAMVIAGSISLDDAARLIARRGALMQALPPGGAMLAVRLDEIEARRWLAGLDPEAAARVSLAAVNGPQDVVLSGAAPVLERLAARFAEAAISARPLPVSHAFHSLLLEPAMPDWRRAGEAVAARPPALTLISTLSGAVLDAAPDADYWCAHARQPVRFADALRAAAEECDVLIEIGAHAVLSAIAQRNQASQSWPHPVACLASLRRDSGYREVLNETLGALYEQGQELDWEAVFPGPQLPPRALPRYPFDRQSYWLDYDEDAPRRPLPLQPQPRHAQPGPVPCHALRWQRFTPPTPRAPHGGVCWLVEVPSDEFAIAPATHRDDEALAAVLREHGYTLRVSAPPDWPADAAELTDDDLVIYAAAWHRSLAESNPPEAEPCAAALDLLWPLVEFVRTLQQHGKCPRVLLPTRRAQSLDGEPCDPLQASLWGAARALALEYAGPRWLMADAADDSLATFLAGAMPTLAACFGQDDALAGRDGQWWRPRLTPLGEAGKTGLTDEVNEAAPLALRHDGLYLVAGAHGALGRHTTQWLAARGARHLVLLGRRAPAGGWQASLALLRSRGIRIDCIEADVASEAQMAQAFAAVDALEAETGRRLAGVFHCAGTSRFNELASITREDCEQVSRAKIGGVWWLHRHTQARALDYFVCYTSISGVWGSRLQIPYGAANCFEDALVRLRRARGLPGLAVAWGPWGGGAGMSEVDDSLLQLLRTAGIRRLAPSRYLATLERLLAGAIAAADGTCVSVEVDWRQFVSLFALYGPTAIFEPCVSGLPEPAAAPSAPAGELAALDGQARAEAVESFVRTELARTLQMAPTQLTPDVELLRFGMDSILVMDFARRCEAALGVKCELKAIFERSTPARLAAYLCERLASTVERVDTVAAEQILADPGQADQPFPLTELQHAYWIGRQGHYALGGVACHAYLEADAEFGLDLALLERCWNQLVARHGALRIVIGEDGRQTILAEVPHYPLRIAELAEAGAEQVADHCAAWREAMSHQVLDAARWPLFDVRATRLPGGAVRLHIGIDMLINDATSGQIIWEELAALYQAGGDAARAGLEPFGISFRDYVLAKYVHSRQREAAREEARAFWLARLDTLPAAPQLPVRSEALRQPRPVFSRWQAQLDAGRWQTLRGRAAEVGCTPASLLIAAFAEVLAAWSTEARFTLNLTTFDRLPWHQDVPRLLGDFTAVTLLPLDCGDPLPFGERAAQVNGAVLDHLQHRAFSAVDVIRERNRGRERHDAVSMPVVFTSQLGMSDPTKGAARDSVLGKVVYGISQTPQVWLDHQVCELDGELIYNWDAIDGLFQPGVVDAMFDAYRQLLARLADDTAAWRVPVPPLLPAAQRAVRGKRNDSAAPLPARCLDQLFFEQARQRPDACALIGAGGSWSYGQLAEWVLRLVQALGHAGVARHDRVAVVMHKGAEQVAACLAIQAAGGAYVPIDADVPAARLHAILQGSRIGVVLTQPDWQPILAELLAEPPADAPDWAPVRLIDASEPALASWPAEFPVRYGDADRKRSLDDPAYVIYTSGSTGTPKGVLIDHRGAVNTVLDVNRRFGIAPGDRVLGLSALYFDLSVYDMFGIFAAGATLVLPQPAGVRDPSHWLEMVERHGITVWNSVPALLELLIDEAQAAQRTLAGLRTVMLSGDWIPLPLPARLAALAPEARLIAMGGATEASIWSNWFEVGQVDPQWHSVPYGYPLGNQCYRVMDGRLRDCPDHVTGDLYIGGIGLALGYENDPDKTAASFLHHPDDGQRLYRTGDLARYWADGTLEFLGRRDFQVKIAGNRIELGEIETALLRHPGVHDAVVDAIGARHGEKRLAAWIVPAADHDGLFDTLSGDAEAHRECWRDALDAARAGFESSVESAGAAASIEDFWLLMDRIGRRMMLDTLVHAGLDPSGAAPELASLLALVRPAPGFDGLLRRWHQGLAAGGPTGAFGSAAQWDACLPAAEAFGLSRGVLLRLREGAAQRLAVLRGEADALELFYGADDTLAPEQLTRMNPLAGPATAALAAAVRACAAALPHAPRILEIGARTGAGTRELLARLQDCELDYTLADPARTLVNQAREAGVSGCERHRVEHRVFDHERDAALQNLVEHDYDLVIAFNALHRSRDIPALLARLRCLLKPGGLLLAPEMTRNSDFQMASVALLEKGYAQLSDRRAATGLPLLAAPAWCEVLGEAGFVEARASGLADAADAGFHLLAARQADRASRFAPRRLIEHLSTLLPAYMIPQTLIRLDALPLSPTGKVARQQLPRPDRRAASGPRRGPASAGLPRDLAGIWQDLLGVESSGDEDDFFDLGGDSLIAVRLIERVRHGLNAHVSLPDLFEAPRLGAFAARVAQAAPWQDERLALQADPARRFDPFPLTDVQQAYWIGRHDSLELGGVSTHLYAEIEVEDLSHAQLEHAWQQLVERHDMLRAVIDEQGMQRVLPEVPPYRIDCRDLREASRAQRAEYLDIVRMALSHEASDTRSWPLFSVQAARMSETRLRLFVSLDNIVCDGLSMRILLAEWSALARRPANVLPPLSIGFRDYVLLSEQAALRPAYQRSLAYWLERLDRLPPGPGLPLAGPDAEANSPPRFTRREASLPPASWQALQARAAAAGITPNALLLTAYGEILAHWSAQPRFTLNLTLFNRPAVHPQIDALVGDFTSLVLLAFEGAGEASLSARAVALQRQLWHDLEHMQVSAVRVLREAARRHRRLRTVAMPVVFTSGLGVAGGAGAADGAGAPREDWLGEFVYGISQTPQVWLDHQVVERGGALVFNWDSVDALFPDGLLDEMFEAYRSLLLRLAHDDAAWHAPVARALPANRWRAWLDARPARLDDPAPAALPSAGGEAEARDAHEDSLREWIGAALASLSGQPVAASPHRNFFESGVSSLDLIRLRARLQPELGLAFSVVDVFAHPSVAALATFLRGLALPDAAPDQGAPDLTARRRQRLDNERRRKRGQQTPP
ncbi:non-ribosomal peptide synthetase/type I polyketide synthase [Burkholderia gladioli]|uniref:non-ribosomal peptide synthetase/type I polyketide synthase n=1 Tax=Burkholderia gladioli TaxID=28095 RepID=UPI001FC7C2BE|nr:non-ribosomal peptide synthetase/type I polyketide synthase [Burkholderia gladioli]